MSLLGALNGTSVLIRVLDTVSGSFKYVYGEISNTATLNNNPIDITNKYSGGFRELLSGEGLQSLDLTAELVFNDAAGFDFVKSQYLTKSINRFQIVRDGIDGQIDEFKAMVTSWAETAPDNDKTTVSVTLTSSNQFERDLQFEEFFADADGQFFTSNNQPFYVRV